MNVLWKKIILFFNRKSFFSDLSTVFSTQILISLINIVLLKIFAYFLIREGVGVYIIVRRLVGLAYPLVTLNLGMSLARYIGLKPQKAKQFFFQSFFLLTTVVLIFGAFLPLYSHILARLIFGEQKYGILIFPALLILYANSLQVIAMGYFRGHQRFNKMNLISASFWIIALASSGIIFFLRQDFIQAFYYYFLVSALLSIMVTIYFVWQEMNPSFKITSQNIADTLLQSMKPDKQFFKYGIHRVPTPFLIGAFFMIPILTASNAMSLEAAAYVGVLVSIVRMVQLTSHPFGLIFVPKLSTFQAQNNREMIRSISSLMLEYIFTIPFLFGLCISFMAREVILLWLGEKFVVVIPYLELLGPFIGFFLAYVLIRGMLDGMSDYPYSNIISLAGVVAISVGGLFSLFFEDKLLILTLSLAAGIIVLGTTSIFFLVREQKLNIFSWRYAFLILWLVVIGIIFILIDNLFTFHSDIIFLMIKLIITIILFGISFVFYRMQKVQWVVEFEQRIF